MTIEEFGRTVKQKHPEYNDLSDADLGSKMLVKFPQYKDMVNQTSDEKLGINTGLEKLIAPVLRPARKFGQDVIQPILDKPLPESLAKLASNTVGKAADIAKSVYQQPLVRETAGAFMRGGLQGETGMTPKEGSAYDIYAKPETPVGSAFQTAGVVTGAFNPESLIGKAIGKTTEAAGKAAEMIPGIKAGEEAATNIISNLSKGAKGKAVDIYRGTLKQLEGSKKFFSQFGGESQVAKEAVALNLPKTQQGMRSEFEKYLPEFNNAVESALAKSKQLGKDFSSKFEEVLSTAKKEVASLNKPGSRQQYKDAMSYLDDVEQTYVGNKTADSLNRIRMDIDSKVGSKTFAEISSGEELAMKKLASGLRDTVKTAVPELKPEFRRYQLMSGLIDAMAKEPKFSVIEALAGGTAGSLAGIAHPATALPSALMTGGAAYAARSPGVRRAGARALYKAPETLPKILKPLTTGVGAAIKPIIGNQLLQSLER